MTKRWTVVALVVATMTTGIAIAQNTRPADTLDDAGKAATAPRRGGGDAESTRQFLGLGTAPDAAAAARGKPAYAENCAACHGPDARGGMGPNLLYSALVLEDEHGNKLTPFLHVGRQEKGMPGFATLGDPALNDIGQFLHLQVENYANRGTYQNTNNVMTGSVTVGAAFFKANCTTCHTAAGDMKGIGARMRPLDLQRAMIFPAREDHPTRAVRASVSGPQGSAEGKLTKIDDFTVVVLDDAGVVHPFNRNADVKVTLKDPLEWHRGFAYRLKDREMTDLVTFLGSLK